LEEKLKKEENRLKDRRIWKTEERRNILLGQEITILDLRKRDFCFSYFFTL